MQRLLHNTQQTADGEYKPSIQSLDRGLLILEAVAKSTSPVKLTDMAALLGVDRSSAFRLAGTLKRRGFLACPPGRKDYILGPAVWRLSRQFDWSGTLVKISHEQLQWLAGETGETAHLAVREARQALFIDHVASTHVIAISGQTGERVPLHCTAHGKALLADLGKSELQALFGSKPLETYTRQTITAVEQLARTCAQIRAKGFATDDGEYGEGIRCVAAPIRDEVGAIVGSIGISAPLSRFPDQRYAWSSRQVLKAAEGINRLLGNQPEENSRGRRGGRNGN